MYTQQNKYVYNQIFRKTVDIRQMIIGISFLIFYVKLDIFDDFRFVGGQINACYNAIDRHIKAGKGKKVALIHDSPVTKSVTKITYEELYEKVCTTYIFI